MVHGPSGGGNASHEPQFAVAYGNSNGSGSAPISEYSSNGIKPTKTVYNQYRNLLLAPGDQLFSHGTTNYTSSIFININRNRYKERIDPGNWQLTLASDTLFNTPGTRSFVDSSLGEAGELGEAGAVYNVWSGSIAGGQATGNTTIYGKFYPDMGVIVLFPAVINPAWPADINYCWCPSSVPAGQQTIGQGNSMQHTTTLVNAFKNANTTFAARSSEKVYTTHYFIRLKNGEYNFSNNPTFTSGSQGQFAHPSMYKDPKVYVTTVGLYNDQNELLATAKLSKPLLKSFTREALIRVKLEF